MTVDWDGVGAATGPAQVYTMMIRGNPMNVAASFELPHPVDDSLRCAAIRHPEREGEIRCPDGLSAIGPLGSGDPDDSEPVVLTDPDGNQVRLGVGILGEIDNLDDSVIAVTETIDLS